MENIRGIAFITYRGEKWLRKIAFRLQLKKEKEKIYYGKLTANDPYSPTIYIKQWYQLFQVEIEGDIVNWIFKEYPENQEMSFENFVRKLREFLKVENDVLEEMGVTQFANKGDNDLLQDIWIK